MAPRKRNSKTSVKVTKRTAQPKSKQQKGQRKITDVLDKVSRDPVIHDSQEAGTSGLTNAQKKLAEKRQYARFQAVVDNDSSTDNEIVEVPAPQSKPELDLKTSPIKIPKIMMRKQQLPADGIGFDKQIYLSDFCVQKYQNHSNVDHIMEAYIATQDQSKNLGQLTSVRFYIQRLYQSPRVKLHFPFLRLKFENPEWEMKLKILIMHPGINTIFTWIEYTSFLEANNLKECRVDMTINNPVHQSAQKSLKKLKRESKYEGSISGKRHKIDQEILEDYYDSVGLRERRLMMDIPLHTLREISNFEEILEELGKDMDQKEYTKLLLTYYRDFLTHRLNNPLFSKFNFHPRYEISYNALAPNHEDFLMTNFEHFTVGSNIESLVQKEHVGETDFDMETELRRLFEIYKTPKRLTDRQWGIFKNLTLKWKYYDEQKEYLNQKSKEQPKRGPSKNSKPLQNPLRNLNPVPENQRTDNSRMLPENPPRTPSYLPGTPKGRTGVSRPQQEIENHQGNQKIVKEPKNIENSGNRDEPEKTKTSEKQNPKKSSSLAQKRRLNHSGNEVTTKRKLPEYLSIFLTHQDEVDSRPEQVEVENNATMEAVLGTQGEIVKECALNMMERLNEPPGNEEAPKTTLNSPENPNPDVPGILHAPQPPQNTTSKTQADPFSQNYPINQILIGKSLALIKRTISQRLIEHTNVVAMVKFIKKAQLKDKFDDEWWARKMQKFVQKHLEKHFFGMNYTLSGLKFKSTAYSVQQLADDMNAFQLTRDLERAEHPEMEQIDPVPPKAVEKVIEVVVPALIETNPFPVPFTVKIEASSAEHPQREQDDPVPPKAVEKVNEVVVPALEESNSLPVPILVKMEAASLILSNLNPEPINKTPQKPEDRAAGFSRVLTTPRRSPGIASISRVSMAHDAEYNKTPVRAAGYSTIAGGSSNQVRTPTPRTSSVTPSSMLRKIDYTPRIIMPDKIPPEQAKYGIIGVSLLEEDLESSDMRREQINKTPENPTKDAPGSIRVMETPRRSSRSKFIVNQYPGSSIQRTPVRPARNSMMDSLAGSSANQMRTPNFPISTSNITPASLLKRIENYTSQVITSDEIPPEQTKYGIIGVTIKQEKGEPPARVQQQQQESFSEVQIIEVPQGSVIVVSDADTDSDQLLNQLMDQSSEPALDPTLRDLEQGNMQSSSSSSNSHSNSTAQQNLNNTANLYKLQHRLLPSYQRELQKLNEPKLVEPKKSLPKIPVDRKRKNREHLNLRKKRKLYVDDSD